MPPLPSPPSPPTAGPLPPFAAVVLAGGTGARMGGADKAGLQLDGRSLLDHALDAVAEAVEVVVVGDPVATGGPVRFVREQPRLGGPAAALLAGRRALTSLGAPPRAGTIAVLACDMPQVDVQTVHRLRRAALGRDGAALCGPDGRRQLALVLDVARLDAVTPPPDARDAMAVRRLLADLTIADVPARADEHVDVDTWADLGRLRDRLEG